MGYYDYHVRKFLRQQFKLMAVIAIGALVLLVPPEAWFPGVDFIPSFWQERALFFVLVDHQEAWVFIGMIALAIWVVVQMVEVVK